MLEERILAREHHTISLDVEGLPKILGTAMEKYCCTFDVTLQELLNTTEANGMLLEVDLFVTYPFYNIRRESGRSRSDYDVFAKQDIAEMLQFSEDAMKPGEADT